MIVPSRGRGFLVVLITFGCLLASDWLTRIRYQDSNYYAAHGWPKLVAFLAAGVIVMVLLPRRGDEVLPGTSLEAPKRGLLGERDSLLFIPVRYWPGVLGVLGVVFYFVRV